MIILDALQHMGMGADDRVGSGVNILAGQGFLIIYSLLTYQKELLFS